VRGVKNPEPATGGADRDDRDGARRNAPLAVAALDRLVSAEDYADFARMFAGIGKASASVFPQAGGKLAHVTVAGEDNSPLDANSEVLRNLNLAMRRFGDPLQPFENAVRELLLLIVSARVRLHPDYRWSFDDERPDEPERGVEPQIRKALYKAFGFERRELGQDVYASEIIATIHQVPGVAYVDLDFLGSVSETEALDSNLLQAKLPPAPLPDRPAKGIEVRFARRGAASEVLPAQLAILSADAADTLILTELA
jgi:predicted phage baseplate assembly protein